MTLNQVDELTIWNIMKNFMYELPAERDYKEIKSIQRKIIICILEKVAEDSEVEQCLFVLFQPRGLI